MGKHHADMPCARHVDIDAGPFNLQSVHLAPWRVADLLPVVLVLAKQTSTTTKPKERRNHHADCHIQRVSLHVPLTHYSHHAKPALHCRFPRFRSYTLTGARSQWRLRLPSPCSRALPSPSRLVRLCGLHLTTRATLLLRAYSKEMAKPCDATPMGCCCPACCHRHWLCRRCRCRCGRDCSAHGGVFFAHRRLRHSPPRPASACAGSFPVYSIPLAWRQAEAQRLARGGSGRPQPRNRQPLPLVLHAAQNRRHLWRK
eukprot:1703071-Prymnesium_polylepis.2